MPQLGDDIYLGTAYIPKPDTDGPSPMDVGVGPMGRTYIFNVVPLTKQAAGLAAIQLLAGAGAFTLQAGTGVTAVVDATGTTRYTLDTPRAVSATVATTDQSAVNLTVTGYDVYGQKMVETFAAPNATTVNGKKAFKSVISVTADAAVATNGISIGYSDILGMPFAVSDKVYVLTKWDNTLALDAGTFTVADATTATATTGDVRGTYLPSGASNGTKRLTVWMHLTAIQCGPNATRAGAVGVAQFGG